MHRNLFVILATIIPSLAFAEQSIDQAVLDEVIKNKALELSLNSQGGLASVEVLVPLFFFLFIFGLVFCAYYWRYRQAKEVQTSVRLMVEKGVDVPIELIVPQQQGSYQADLRKGLTLTALGVFLPIALAVSNSGGTEWVWGLIPLALGVAYLALARIGQRAKSNG